MRVVIIGPPGAGKSTQAERLARERNLPRISTGDVLREALRPSAPLGLKAKPTVEQVANFALAREAVEKAGGRVTIGNCTI